MIKSVSFYFSEHFFILKIFCNEMYFFMMKPKLNSLKHNNFSYVWRELEIAKIPVFSLPIREAPYPPHVGGVEQTKVHPFRTQSSLSHFGDKK